MSESASICAAGSPASILAEARAIAMAALARWDLAIVSIEPIKVRENAVFRVECGGGTSAALRVHRAGYHTDAALTSEFSWMHALGESGLPVPRVIRSRDGNNCETVEAPGLQGSRQVDVLEWIEGRAPGSVEASVAGDASATAARYRIIGGVIGRMHNQAASWGLPPGFERHAWDASGLIGDHPLWGRFWDLAALTPGERDLMQRTRIRLARDLACYPKLPDQYGLIHADLVPENIMVTDSGLRVIDFDDAGFGWHWFDIATSLYFITAESYYPQVLAALLAGYAEERPLPGDAMGHLKTFMAARSTTYLGWVHTRQGTSTAIELTPYLVERACDVCSAYLATREHA
jgi:Ser/Thr protein kinase RdoA (MazF antagonist)